MEVLSASGSQWLSEYQCTANNNCDVYCVFFLVINEIPCDMNFYVKFQFLVVGDIFLVLLPRIYFTAPLVTSDLHSSKLDFYDRSDGFIMILGCYIFDDDNASFGFQRD